MKKLLQKGLALLDLLNNIKNDQLPPKDETLEFLRKVALGSPLTGQEEQDFVTRILKPLGLDDKLGEIKEQLDELDENNLRRLIMQLKELPHDEWSFPLVDMPFSPKTLQPASRFPISAGFGVNLGASLQAPEPIPPWLQSQKREGYTLLQLGVDGSFNASASTSGGGLKGSAGFKGSATYDLFFRNPNQLLLAGALIENLPEITKALSIPEEDNPLCAMELQAKGSLSLGGDVSFKQGLGSTVIDGLGSPISVSAGLNASASFGFKIEGDFLVQGQHMARGYLISLSRSKSQQLSGSLGIGVEVGIAGIDKVVSPFMGKFLPDAQPLIDKLTVYTDLKKMVTDAVASELSEAIKDDGVRDLVLAAFGGTLNDDDVDRLILEKAGSLLDEQIGALAAKGEPAAQKIANQLLGGLNDVIPGTLNFLEPKIKDLFVEQSAKLKEKILEKLKEILNEADPARLLSPVEKIGAEVDVITGTIQERADRILKPLLEFLNKYQAFRLKVARAVAGAANLKLSLALSYSYSRTRSSGVNLKFLLDPSHEDADRLFRKMIVGRYEEAMQLGFSKSPVVEILQESSFTRADITEQSMDLNFKGLGLALSSTSWLNTSVEATWDLSGNVTMGVKGNTGHSKKALGESRTGRFFSDFELAGAATGNKLLNMGLTLSYQDEKLHISELRGYLRPFLAVDLIRQEALDAIVADYNKVAEKKSTNAEIGVSLSFDSQNINRMVNLPQERVKKCFIANFTDYLANDRATKHYLGNAFGMTTTSPDQIAARIVETSVQEINRDIFDLRRLSKTAQINDLKLVLNAKALAGSVVQGFEKVAQLLQTKPKVDNDKITNFLDIRKLQEDIAQSFKPFTGVSMGFLWDNSPRWRNIIFFRSIVELLDEDGGQFDHLPIVIKWNDQGGQQQIYL